MKRGGSVGFVELGLATVLVHTLLCLSEVMWEARGGGAWRLQKGLVSVTVQPLRWTSQRSRECVGGARWGGAWRLWNCQALLNSTSDAKYACPQQPH